VKLLLIAVAAITVELWLSFGIIEYLLPGERLTSKWWGLPYFMTAVIIMAVTVAIIVNKVDTER
jgi:hypothetical protein